MGILGDHHDTPYELRDSPSNCDKASAWLRRCAVGVVAITGAKGAHLESGALNSGSVVRRCRGSVGRFGCTRPHPRAARGASPLYLVHSRSVLLSRAQWGRVGCHPPDCAPAGGREAPPAPTPDPRFHTHMRTTLPSTSSGLARKPLNPRPLTVDPKRA